MVRIRSCTILIDRDFSLNLSIKMKWSIFTYLNKISISFNIWFIPLKCWFHFSKSKPNRPKVLRPLSYSMISKYKCLESRWCNPCTIYKGFSLSLSHSLTLCSRYLLGCIRKLTCEPFHCVVYLKVLQRVQLKGGEVKRK